MGRKYLLGNEAIAHGCLSAGVSFVCGYPGTPSSEVIDFLRSREERDYYLEWSINEKVALENAIGASWSGLRSFCTMKHVGLNVASDPFMTLAYTGVKAGLVIMSADDPFAHSSQNEQDSRNYAKFAKVPCFDPANIQESHDMIPVAFSLSEEFELPVLFRPTTRVCHSKGDVEIGKNVSGPKKGHFERDVPRYVVVPVNTRELHKKLNHKQSSLKKRIIELGLNTSEVRGDTAVISSGVSAEYVREVLHDSVSFAKIGAYPIDEDWLRSFVEKHKRVVVIEELDHVIESRVREVACNVIINGKMDGKVPYEGEFAPNIVSSILQSCNIKVRCSYPARTPVQGLPPRPAILCAGCAHRATFYSIKRVYSNAVYPSDIGCYTLGLQLDAVDTTVCMGASITIGTGISHSTEDQNVICTIGDSTFLHSGLTGLLNAVYNDSDITVVILDNRTTAMTGHQPNPMSGCDACGQPKETISLDALSRSCGVKFVETIDPYDLMATREVLEKAKKERGVRVIIAKASCVISRRRSGGKSSRYTVDIDRCNGCGSCIRFGCPALFWIDDQAHIDNTCTGCTVCEQICPQGAIRKEAIR